jgi:hypothetical protein
VESAARVLDVHKNTIRRWLNEGLRAVDDRRPTLIRGEDLIHFLEERRRKSKQTCPPGHLYCVKCRAPKQPAGDIAEYMPISHNTGNLRGICPTCESLIHRRVNRANLERTRGQLEISFPQAHPHIGESAQPSINGHFGMEP